MQNIANNNISSSSSISRSSISGRWIANSPANFSCRLGDTFIACESIVFLKRETLETDNGHSHSSTCHLLLLLLLFHLSLLRCKLERKSSVERRIVYCSSEWLTKHTQMDTCKFSLLVVANNELVKESLRRHLSLAGRAANSDDELRGGKLVAILNMANFDSTSLWTLLDARDW